MEDQFSFTGSDISVAPSDTALSESLNVLNRTIDNGGLSEESSLVYNNGTVVQGERGPEAELGVDTHAGANFPGLLPGKTTADVETTIHSHLTATAVVGGQGFGGNAQVPSLGANADEPTFAQYKTNIIVGPLGPVTGSYREDKDVGRVYTIDSRKNGVVIYNNGGIEHSFKWNVDTVKKIIGK